MKLRGVLDKKIIYFLLGVIAFAMALFCFEKYPENKIAWGVKIDNINVGGKTEKEAKEILDKKIKELLEKKVVFELKKNSVVIAQREEKISYFSPKYNIEKDIKNAFLIGKKGNFFLNLKEKFLALFGKIKIMPTIKVQEEKVDEFLTKNFGKFEALPKNAIVYFSLSDGSFKVKEEENGKMFERKEIKNYLENNLKNFKTPNICLALNEDSNCFYIKNVKAEIKKEAAIKAKEKADEILDNCPYYLKTDFSTFSLGKNTLGNWFLFVPQKDKSLELSLDEKLIEEYLINLSFKINIEPQNPVLSFENEKINIVEPPKEGRVLNIKESIKTIKKEILNKNKNITLVIETKKPEITEEKIKDLKIEKLIGKGTSNFYGSPKNRINNIKVAASKFNGVLIAPNEVFSFNKTLGNVTAKEGYLPELVIKENKTVPEYGGGICQVSTTMFRAAVYSGLEIIERHAHAFPVSYYNPQGFDATVYQPSPDLKFKNNTGNYILVQTKIQGYNLIFEFYGKDDGRKVIVKGPYQYDFKPDGSMKAKLIEEVWKDNKLIHTQTFYSFYDSPNKYPHTR